MSVRAVVFDIGNVLVEWRPEEFLDRYIGEARRRAFLETVPIMHVNDEIDAGRDFDEALESLLATYPDWTDALTAWRDRIIESIAPPLDHSVRLLRALRRADVPVLALSNFGAKMFAVAQREYPFLEEFDQTYVSAHLELIKPDPAIYAHLEAQSGFAPAELLFADDRQENIETAAARGWNVHHFDRPQTLADRLVSEGLLTEEAAQ
ncbi:MAG: HAD family phosphatase [Pseudomonadota bacterium]